jgi:(S)-mandelate dehydrogenase
VPFTLATPAGVSLERIAAEAGGRLWFQLYVVRERSFREKLVERAKNAGYEALLVTVDLPVSGKRERDPRNGFITPFRPNWRNTRDVWRKPAWIADFLRHGAPQMVHFDGYPFSDVSATDLATAVGREMDASFNWDDLKRIRDLWPRRLVLKGIERPDDAERAAAAGCDGVVVSNHGGRQLDGAAATLDALPLISRAVGSRLSVLLDGGVRRGVDLLKARALGAQGVLVGRATLFGVMAGGEAGARHALGILATEYERSMRLCGVRSTAEIAADLLFENPERSREA